MSNTEEEQIKFTNQKTSAEYIFKKGKNTELNPTYQLYVKISTV